LKKVLYLTDLDGTLLRNDKTISDFSKEKINEIISRGVNFSIATARSLNSAKEIVKSIKFKYPVSLMNGVGFYDFEKKKFDKVEKIEKAALNKVIEFARKYNIFGFVYTFENDGISRYYENSMNNKAVIEFCEEREIKYNIVFSKVDDLKELILIKDTVYYNTVEKYEKLIPLVNELKNMKNTKFVFYRDVYLEDYWFLEVFSDMGTKYNATRYFREKFNFDKIIGFGDNDNDLALFEGCDEFYAVSNAVDTLREKANGIIDDNDSDGVIKYILKRENI
jgi:Cof subfamily protein (haloacid dehalogenase superfamily)